MEKLLSGLEYPAKKEHFELVMTIPTLRFALAVPPTVATPLGARIKVRDQNLLLTYSALLAMLPTSGFARRTTFDKLMKLSAPGMNNSNSNNRHLAEAGGIERSG